KRQQARLHQYGRYNWTGGETDRSQYSELTQATIDDGVHGVDRSQRRADSHDASDEVSGEIEQSDQLAGILRDDLTLVPGLEAQSWIGPQRGDKRGVSRRRL